MRRVPEQIASDLRTILAADDAHALDAWLMDASTKLSRPSGSWMSWTIADRESRAETGLLITASKVGACDCLMLLARRGFAKGLWRSMGAAGQSPPEATLAEKDWLRDSASAVIGVLALRIRIEKDDQRRHNLEQTLLAFATSFLRKDDRELQAAIDALREVPVVDKRLVQQAIRDAATADEGERIGDGIRVPPSSGKRRAF